MPPAPADATELECLRTELAALTRRVASLEHRLAHPHELPPAIVPDLTPILQQPLPPPIPPPPPRASLEDRLGSQVFNWIGMAALLIGASWALKLAFEHGLIGPAGRVLIGLAAGAGLILWSERFRRKSLPAFSYSLKAVGSGILYLALWAAFQLYHLLPAAAAFAAMLAVTAWIAFMAWSQSAELLAAYALAGALATPLLVSTGGDHQTFLFSYLATLAAAIVLLLRARPWPRLLIPSFLATVGYFIAWYMRFFHPYPTAPAWNSQSTETALFSFIFFALFSLPSLRGWSRPLEPSATRSRTLVAVLLPLANAAFLALALYSVFQDSGLHTSLAWLMLALAALSLALARIQATTLGTAMQLAIAVILLTIAIPLKASGHTLTTAWLVEGLVLYWASTRVPAAEPSVRFTPVQALRLLSILGFSLGLLALAISSVNRPAAQPDTFFNATFGTSLVAVAALACAAWLAFRVPAPAPHDHPTITLALVAISLVAVLLIVPELAPPHTPHPAFTSTPFFTALVGLAILLAAALIANRLGSIAHSLRELTRLAAAALVAFNLFAVITGVREINALWQTTLSISPDTSVQRALATSAFLMLYGAILLAIGFRRRDAFIRWQALALLVFTILKVFLYDVSGLSQGYRVVSFLLLGALLMAVSFAYQKDWLGLKNTPPLPTPPVPPA